MDKEPGKTPMGGPPDVGGPAFPSAGELAEAYRTLRRSSPAARKSIPRLRDATSLFDVFEALRQAASQSESDRLLHKHALLADLASGKQATRRLLHVRNNPALACLADPTGKVRVDRASYDVLSEDGARQLLRLINDPELPDDGGTGGGTTGGGTSYAFTQLPPEDWAQLLPCGPWTVLPGYPTHFFDARIGGRVVLVQLWKGSCPDYFLGNGAGGVGAEVGLYNRDAFQPTSFWWPDAAHRKIVEFTLFNPVTTAPFFSAPTSVPIWWSHKWMKFDSYDRYVRDQQGRVPASTEQYVLRCRIDGSPFEW